MPNSMICECTAGVLEESQDAMTTMMNKGDMRRALYENQGGTRTLAALGLNG